MRSISCVTVLLMIAAACASSAGVPRDEIARLESLWNDAQVRGDADLLERVSADDLVVTVPAMRPFTKVEAFAVLRTGHMKITRYDTSDVRIRTDGDAAVVTGRMQRSRVFGERTIDEDWRFTKVYVREARGWKVVSFHASPAN